jgi:hypothetical protein
MSESHNIISCRYDEDWTRIKTESVGNIHEYEVRWKVVVDDNNMTGGSVLYQLRVLIQKLGHPSPAAPYDRVPIVGENYCDPSWESYKINPYYDHLDHVDQSSFCSKVSCELIDPKAPDIWRITATYTPPMDTGPQVIDSNPLDADPLKWPVITWFEFVEDQSVVELATCFGFYTNDGTFIDLPHLSRGVTNEYAEEPGPIVNAAGQQTIDPQMEISHRIIYNAKVNYPNHFYAAKLNRLFENTMHASPLYLQNPVVYQYNISENVPLLLGYPHGTWKFLVAEPEVRNFRVNDDVIMEYCATTIKFEIKMGQIVDEDDEFKFYSGWNRLVLNNGQVCLRKMNSRYGYPGEDVAGDSWVRDPRYSSDTGLAADGGPRYKLLFPTTAMKLKDAKVQDFAYLDPRVDSDGNWIPNSYTGPRHQPVVDDLEEVETAEPVNLNEDGTQSTEPTVVPNHIWYNNLRAVDYNYYITNYYGDSIFYTLPGADIDPDFPCVNDPCPS